MVGAGALGLLALSAPAARGETLAIEQLGEAGAVLATMPLECAGMGCRGTGAFRGPYGPIPAVILLRFDVSAGRACLSMQRPEVPTEPYRWDCAPREADGGTETPWRLVAEDWLPDPGRRGMERFSQPWPPTWLHLRLRSRP